MDDMQPEDGLTDSVTSALKGYRHNDCLKPVPTPSLANVTLPNADLTLPDATGGQTKRCTRCHQDRPVSQFSKSRRGCPLGLYSQCRWCETVKNAARRLGLPREALEAYVRDHDGRCDCCGRVCRTNSRLCVDHSHRSGIVRAMLCNDCNVAAGRLGDDWRTAQRLTDIMRLADEVLEPAFAKPPTLQIGATP